VSDPFDVDAEERRLALVRNERSKLAANALDRLSTASIAAGFIAPAASLSDDGIYTGYSIALAVSTIVWIFAAATLHLGARFMLGRLKPWTLLLPFIYISCHFRFRQSFSHGCHMRRGKTAASNPAALAN